MEGLKQWQTPAKRSLSDRRDIMNKVESENLSRRGAGRPKGTPNKTTALLKDAIIQAAESQGDGGADGLMGYCRFLARDEPKAFAQLLGKVLPMQITGEDGGAITVAFKTVYENRGD